MCSKSCVSINKDYQQPLGLYTIVTGLPGSNKTSGITLFKEAFMEMEKFLHLDSENQTEFFSSLNKSMLLFSFKIYQIHSSLFIS